MIRNLPGISVLCFLRGLILEQYPGEKIIIAHVGLRYGLACHVMLVPSGPSKTNSLLVKTSFNKSLPVITPIIFSSSKASR